MVSTYINILQATIKPSNGDLFRTNLICTFFEQPSRQTCSTFFSCQYSSFPRLIRTTITDVILYARQAYASAEDGPALIAPSSGVDAISKSRQFSLYKLDARFSGVVPGYGSASCNTYNHRGIARTIAHGEQSRWNSWRPSRA